MPFKIRCMVHSDAFKDLVLAIAHHPAVRQLGKTKLWKLIYFIEAEMLREHCRTLTGSEFIRYEHGPVPSRGEKILKDMNRKGLVSVTQEPIGTYQLQHIAPIAEATHALGADEQDIINRICIRLGGMSASALSELSHGEPAWLSASPMGKLDPILMAYGSEEDAEGL